MTRKPKRILRKNEAHCTANPVRPRLMSLKNAAKYLDRGTHSLRELVYRHEIRVIQNGRGKMWFDVRELDEWIEENLRYA